MVRLTGSNPLGYTGVQPASPTNFITNRSDPTSNDWQNFFLGDEWLNTKTNVVWKLVSLVGNRATWVSITSGELILQVNTDIDSPVNAVGGVLNVLGDGEGFIQTTGFTPNTVKVGPGANLALSFSGNNPGAAIASSNNLVIKGDGTTATTVTSGNTITISAIGSGSGTVTSISAGTGITLTPSPITSTGSIALTTPVVPTHTDGVVYYDGTNLVDTTVGTAGQVLTSNGAGNAPTFQAAGSAASTMSVFTSNGTWTKAAGANMVTVIGWGGGGGGGSGGQGVGNSTGSGVGGGSGGSPTSCFWFTSPAAFFGATETVTVGVGGSGGAAVTSPNTAGNNGTAGTPSSFGNIKVPAISNGFNFGRGGLLISTSVTPGGNAGYMFTQPATLYPYFNATNPATSLAMPQSVLQLNINANNFNLMGAYANPGTIDPNGAPSIGGYAASWPNAPSVGGSGYTYLTPTGGGGGNRAGANVVGDNAGSNGGDVYKLDGITVITAGGLGGAADTDGSDGNNTINTDGSALISGGIIYGGTGGGGGGGMISTGGGNGGHGGFPGGGGGGGGASLNGTDSGAGGNGANGMVIVIQW